MRGVKYDFMSKMLSKEFNKNIKGEIITVMPKRKDGKIDWLSTKGMEITIKSYEYGLKEFKIINSYREGKLTFISIEYNGVYVGDVDCSLILKGNIGVLIGEIPKERYRVYYKYNKK